MSLSLWPSEHGAYVQLGMPLLTGLALAPSLLAHEPVMLLSGARGRRAKARLEARARLRLGALLCLAVATAAAGAWLAPPSARLALALPGVAGLAVMTLIRRGAEKTIPGELLVAAALSAILLPLGLCGDHTPGLVATVTVGWWHIFSVQILAVHALKRGGWLKHFTVLTCGGTILLSLLAAGASGYPSAALALVPPAVAALAAVFSQPHPGRLKRAGWRFAAADCLAIAMILASLLSA
jgi:hypothetical protein